METRLLPSVGALRKQTRRFHELRAKGAVTRAECTSAGARPSYSFGCQVRRADHRTHRSFGDLYLSMYADGTNPVVQRDVRRVTSLSSTLAHLTAGRMR